MGKLLLTILVFAAGTSRLVAQVTALFTVEQPPLFLTDAGADQIFSGGPLTLGGEPTAVGGGGQYGYAWEPALGLDDPSAPNPVLEELAATTVFTVSVTDLLTGCVKTDQVLITLDTGTGLDGHCCSEALIMPNPAATNVWVRADAVLGTITVRSLSGQQVLLVAHPDGRTAVLDIASLSDGMYVLNVTMADGRLITHKLCKASSDF